MPAAPPADALDALRSRWGYSAFRPGQDEAVAAALAGRDVLAVLPTGGGKSLVYQVPAVVRPGVVLVVSPLVALMRDQVDALARRGVPAVAVHGRLSPREADQVWTNAEFGRYRLVYLTPERLQTELFQARAPRLDVSLLAVDEAHCVSEWGHDFRPAYRRIAEARPLLTDAEGRPAPAVAVTATATPEVRRDVLDQLALRDPAVVVRGFDRPNLVWSVHHVQDPGRQVLDVFTGVAGAGLVYAGTRRGTEEAARRLAREGISAEPYHAGLDPDRRDATQRRWLEGETRVIAATSAFGMGIDKPDVRAVVHTAPPLTIESYYQEAGRAGRDGQRAYAALALGPDAARGPRALVEASHPTAAEVQAVYDAAGSLAQLAVGALPDGPTVLDLARVAAVAGVSGATVRAAADRLAAAGAWDVVREREGVVHVRVPNGLDRLADLGGADGLRAFVRALSRELPPAAAAGWTAVRLDRLAPSLGLAPARLDAGLDHLAGRGAIEVRRPAQGLTLAWAAPRSRFAPTDGGALGGDRRRAGRRLDDVLAYASGAGCRRQHLLAYFGEPAPPRCGRCDVCLGRHRAGEVTPADEPALRGLLRAAEQGETAAAPGRRERELADWLAHEGYLRLTDPLAVRYELTPKGQRHLERGG
ncbi:RecQ family ATP-dependent DNA helicase [Rubrivirga sp. S365]|uniref:RecQ family ATP-dependent DNA helicase n=1 Tax=Rubrivirga sp. S365 TaxID=3076080 RepID=UPI0028C79688|nr:RecQ family ATP-dependent DNA helicase [Rubrivirga sp. S365]MDT7857969.1 RecQ family ATP-dependent DNA helicase [Rubrivirga sp. S365]